MMIAAPVSKPHTASRELDELTLRRAQRGDEAAFRSLVERYHRPVYSLLWRLLERSSGQARAEELTQETFLRVFRALPRFDVKGRARLSTWMLTIATRLALNEMRTGRGRGVVEVPLEAEQLSLAGEDRPDRALERRRLAEAIGAAIAGLKPDQRAALVLREFHGLEYTEIAETLDIDLGTVKSRLSRARAALRRALQEVRHES